MLKQMLEMEAWQRVPIPLKVRHGLTCLVCVDLFDLLPRRVLTAAGLLQYLSIFFFLCVPLRGGARTL